MRTFKQFLAEAVLNFPTEDSSPAAKAKGRSQIVKAAAIESPTFDAMKPYFKKATAANIKDGYNKFLTAFPKEARAINALKPDGVGPGEFIMYFVFDNVGIGGKNASIDIFVDGKEFAEAKAGGRSGTTMNNFKLGRDSDKSVTQILKDLEEFNDKYHEIHGEDLPGWRGANELTVNTLRSWVDIDLKKASSEVKGGSKKSIDLILKKDGDLLRKGEEEPIMNVNKAKSVAPLRQAISGNATVAVDTKVGTLQKIIDRWKDLAFTEYVDGKKFAILDKNTLELKHFGELTKDMVGLYTTHRNQPWAEVYLEPKKSKAEAKAEK